ncbi:MAG: carboxypeptidase-like regulatory domain-containing protein [Flavobacterium sp.]|nr:carboxypeptidase-like regulatory domain-containing protein [Flavobacterium sp.]
MNKILLLLALLIGAIGFSQNIKFEGIIEDIAKKPLEMANVMAVNLDTKAMDAYAITNDKGKFILNLNANANYSIRLSFLGMKSQDITIVTQGENIKRTITMEEGGIDLEGVEIVQEMPVSIKGDTIIYNADSFKTGTERKLEDVLKKLPGVEVNADGEIEVEGKKVQKLMVEGKDFFDGDTKLGVKNIPADAIDKVQVLRNYSEIGALKGLENNEDNIAMNIKLKKGKKNFWFGDMTAGIGVGHDDGRYVVNPKLFYYSPKYSVNLIGNFNNIGELPFTAQDYFKFTGGFRNMMQKGGTNFNISSNDLGLSLLRNNRAKEIETDFGATNFSYNPTKTWTISGFVIGSSTLTDLQTKTQTSVLQPDSDEVASTENRNQTTHQRSNLGLFKLSSSYRPNTKLQFDYDGLLKLSSQDENSSLVSEVFPNTAQNQTVATERSQSPVSFNQNLGLYYTMDDKNVFAFEAQHLYTNEDPFYNPNLGTNPFPDAAAAELGIVSQDRFNINQQRFVKTNKIDSKLDYYYMLTPKSNINVTLGNTNSRQNFNSYIFQILDNGTQNDLNADLTTNNVTYSFNDLFLGMHYKFITGKFTFNPGFSVHKFNTYNDQKNTRVRDDFYRFQPDVYALYQIKKSETLSYSFAITSDFTDINRFAENVTLSNYNSLFSGNRNLENATLQVHSLRYFRYNMFNFTNIFANISYTRRVDAIKLNYLFIGNNQVSTAENISSNFPDESLSGSANYGRSFFKYYKASIGFNLAWSKSNNIRSNLANDSSVIETKESFTHNYTIKASTNFKTLPNLEIGYNIGINTYSGTTFYTERPFARLDYYFFNSLAFVADYSFYHYTNNDDAFPVDNEYDFLDTSLVYQKKDSKWEYKIGITNLLNTTSLNDDSFSPPVISSSQYVVQPRYIIFSMKYNL